MKLQISFDMPDLEKAIEISRQVSPYCDILEINTILIYAHGIAVLKKFRELFPDKIILADSKIVDRGKDITTLLGTTPIDWITVMAGTDKSVIHAACTTARSLNKKIMLDLIDSNPPDQSALEAQSLGAHALLFHGTRNEDESNTFLEKWDMIRGNTTLPIFVTANISRENIDSIIKIRPDGIIIGSAITNASNPAQEAQFFYELCLNS